MPKQLPDLNALSTLTDDDLLLIRDIQSSVDYKLTAVKLREYVKTDLFEMVSPTKYGAVGDGIANDTLAVQECLDNEKYVIIDLPFAVNEIVIPSGCYVTSINSGEFICTVDDAPSLVKEWIIINSEHVGRIIANGNGRQIKAITYRTVGGVHSFDYLEVFDVHAIDSDKNTTMGVFFRNGKITGNTIYNHNFVQATGTGITNGSIPQGTVCDADSDVRVDRIITEEARAGLVTVEGCKVVLGDNICIKTEDNGGYLLGGDVKIGMHYYEVSSDYIGEESLQINAVDRLDVDEIVVKGRALGCCNFQNTKGPVTIGRIVGLPADGVLESDWAVHVPTAICYNRQGSIFENNIYIGSVMGYFQRGMLFAGSSVVESVTVGPSDITLCYNSENNPVNQWVDQSTTFWDFRAVKRVVRKDVRLRIRNFDVAPFGAAINFACNDRTSHERSELVNERYELVENNGSLTTLAHLRGGEPQSGLRIEGACWRVIGGVTYRVDDAYGGFIPDSTNLKPTTGYWLKGQKLLNRNFEYKVDDVESFHNMATGTIGSGANWQEVRGTAPQIADIIPPPVGLIPDVRGQFYLDTSTTPRTVWYGFALSAGSWIRLNNEV